MAITSIGHIQHTHSSSIPVPVLRPSRTTLSQLQPRANLL